MSNDYLKIADYLDQNNMEYQFLMEQYEKMINGFDCETYSLEFLLLLVERYEGYDTDYKDINYKRDEFLKKVICHIYKKLNIEFVTMGTDDLIDCFFFLNRQYNIYRHPKLVKKLNKTLKHIFDILIRRGRRYYLESEIGYQFDLTEKEQFFFQQYNVVILKKIKTSDEQAVQEFIKKCDNQLETERLDKELAEYFE
jgi:hypothetical protein